MKMEGHYVFPGTTKDRPLGVMTMAMAMRRPSEGEVTMHRVRSAARSWMTDQPVAPNLRNFVA